MRQRVLESVVTAILLGVLAGAWSTYTEVKMLRMEVTQHNKEIERLWDQVAERTADQWALEREVAKKKR
ncbi:MAG: hypothetical protein ACM369_08740 [Acidobacteriota bacterium]